MDSSRREANSINIVESVKDILLNSFESFSDKSFVGTKIENSYMFQTFGEVENMIKKLSNYFINELYITKENIYTQFSFKNTSHHLIGIYTKPCKEALVAMLALHNTSENITAVPIFDNINSNDLKFILSETELRTLIVDKDCMKMLMSDDNLLKSSKIKNLIVILNDYQESFLDYEEKLSRINLIKFVDINENSNPKEIKKSSPSPERIILLTYTSGSKGVLISEKSLINTFNNLLYSNAFQIDIDDVHYSLTSLADVPEYLVNLHLMTFGGSIGYFSGDCCRILQDIKLLKPTILYSFPRILIKIYEALQGIINKLDEAKKNMIEQAIKAKVDHFNHEKSLNHHIWDKLLFNKIRDSLGGKIKLILVGGGHLNSHIFEFLKICLSTNIVEIYGVTESCGVIALSNEGELGNKYLGNCLESNEIKIKKCDQVGYFSPYGNTVEASTKNYGEICVKGDNLFSGYFNKEKSHHLDEEGYFHTGDYVVLLDCFKDGMCNLKYIDQIENFIITKQGFLISPSQLEEYYILSEYISQVTVIADTDLNLVAIVLLNKNKIFKENNDEKNRKGSLNGNLMYKTGERKGNFREKKSHSIFSSSSNMRKEQMSLSAIDTNSEKDKYSYDNLMMNPNENEKLKEEILKSFKLIWSSHKLKTHELITKIFILEKEFSPCIENGILTSKMKLKRDSLKNIYFEFLDHKSL